MSLLGGLKKLLGGAEQAAQQGVNTVGHAAQQFGSAINEGVPQAGNTVLRAVGQRPGNAMLVDPKYLGYPADNTATPQQVAQLGQRNTLQVQPSINPDLNTQQGYGDPQEQVYGGGGSMGAQPAYNPTNGDNNPDAVMGYNYFQPQRGRQNLQDSPLQQLLRRR